MLYWRHGRESELGQLVTKPGRIIGFEGETVLTDIMDMSVESAYKLNGALIRRKSDGATLAVVTGFTTRTKPPKGPQREAPNNKDIIGVSATPIKAFTAELETAGVKLN